ncbi:YceI family protein [Herbiconiux ginsengi]|uniref:Polyisoprenoid-binding protein YceI n=1 Tax=Herbiconiux ginsengi TaxID=381665 RepID=A0A1H3SZ44_9MICO|nr:YceI family protein [Herbiconiux ginsengi]SDZ43194.1 Polyisoprenoid-binding protein YceI [Herbiconiux ginsengi]
MTITATSIPGYVPGTWKVDRDHARITFSVRHLAISKVRGTFDEFDVTLVTAEDPADSTIEATIEIASVNTAQPARDAHLRTSDFFAAEEFPQMHFRSTGHRTDGDRLLIDGDLTLRGVTRPVTLTTEFGGIATDSLGQVKIGAEATTTIDRTEFGVNWNAATEAGGLTLGTTIAIAIEIQLTLQK